MRATVLNLAVVGAGCLIAAATLVPEGKQFAPGQMVMGVPGKAIRAVTEAERARSVMASPTISATPASMPQRLRTLTPPHERR